MFQRIPTQEMSTCAFHLTLELNRSVAHSKARKNRADFILALKLQPLTPLTHLACVADLGPDGRQYKSTLTSNATKLSMSTPLVASCSGFVTVTAGLVQHQALVVRNSMTCPSVPRLSVMPALHQLGIEFPRPAVTLFAELHPNILASLLHRQLR
jgi:hypothetical protein